MAHKLCLAVAAALLVSAAVPAVAQVATYGTTDKGGTVTTGGVAQAAIAANPYRQIWCIQNSPDETEDLFVRLGGTASATSGIAVEPGKQVCSYPAYLDRSAVSVFAATTGHRWFGFEGE